MGSYPASSKSVPAGLGWAAWGATTLFIQLPLVQMILADTQSLELGAWNVGTLGLFLGVTFGALPAALALLFGALGRVRRGLGIGSFLLFFSFLFLMQVNFHFLQLYFMDAAWRHPLLVGGWIGAFGVGWRFREFFTRMLGALAPLGAVLALLFAVQAAPGAHAASIPAPPSAAASSP